MHFIWSLLPITLFLMAAWAWLKPILKVPGREDGKRYFVMFIVCSVVLWISIRLDNLEAFKQLVKQVTMGSLDYRIVSWLIYPALLYFISLAWDLYEKKK